MRYETIVMGVSAGGMEALSTILPYLPVRFTLSVMVVQHQHPASDNFLVHYLDERCRLRVKQADEKEPILAGVVYFAPPDYHLLVEQDKTLSLSVDPLVNFARPSIDVLFESAADVYRSDLVGVILTGASTDGSQGLKRVKESGGMTIVQDPKTAVSDTMPKAALAATEVDHVLPLEEMGPFIGGLSH